MFSETKYLRYFGQQCDLFPKLGLRLHLLHKALEVASNGQSWTIALEDSGGPTVEFTSTLLGIGSREYSSVVVNVLQA